MIRISKLVALALMISVTACYQAEPETPHPSIQFQVEPDTGTVKLVSASQPDVPSRMSITELPPTSRNLGYNELGVERFRVLNLEDNLMQLEVTFRNITTDLVFAQPFTFIPETRRGILWSKEPAVSDADLGGDAQLSPDELSRSLVFEVKHRGRPFTYSVFVNSAVGEVEP